MKPILSALIDYLSLKTTYLSTNAACTINFDLPKETRLRSHICVPEVVAIGMLHCLNYYTLQIPSSETRTFLAAKSRWTYCFKKRKVSPQATCRVKLMSICFISPGWYSQLLYHYKRIIERDWMVWMSKWSNVDLHSHSVRAVRTRLEKVNMELALTTMHITPLFLTYVSLRVVRWWRRSPLCIRSTTILNWTHTKKSQTWW